MNDTIKFDIKTTQLIYHGEEWMRTKPNIYHI